MNLLKAKISGIARGVIVFIALVLQVATMFIISSALQQYATVAYLFIEMLSVILAFRLANDYKEYKEFWLVIVIVLPVFGYFMYFIRAFAAKLRFASQVKKVFVHPPCLM